MSRPHDTEGEQRSRRKHDGSATTTTAATTTTNTSSINRAFATSMSTRIRACLLLLACTCLLQLAPAATGVMAQEQAPAPTVSSSSSPKSRPNIVMILADDQDLLLGSLDYMPQVRRLFGDEGTFFERHYCTVAQCCPSRVSLLTGKAAHNTNITSVSLPYGGYSRFIAQGLNGHWLPSWMQESGYDTYYVGKLMNNHSVSNYNDPYPKGFNATDFLIDPGTYIYYNATMQSNQDPPRNLPGQYSTDLVAARALQFMQDGVSASRPFFLTVAPIGPHSQTVFATTPGAGAGALPRFDPPVPATEYENLYQGVKVPRTANYNAMGSNPPSYFKNLSAWNETVQAYHDEYYRLRLAALASVDDLVAAVLGQADRLGITNDTYFIYTSDNGYHIGQHRLPAGKECTIEEDIRVPFLIRGPGVARGVTVTVPTTHTDLAPTILKLAGVPLRDDFDGSPMPVFGSDNSSLARPDTKNEHVNVEFWGPVLAEGKYGFGLLGPINNNTYKSLRLISPSYNLQYVVWCTNERELYDMTGDDDQQLDNLALDFSSVPSNSSSSSPLPTSSSSFDSGSDNNAYILNLQSRLDTLLMVLKTCQADTCRHPWRVMHPDGTVHSLVDAMAPKYDAYYRAQPKIRFTACAPGYLRALEGPGADRGDILPYSGS